MRYKMLDVVTHLKSKCKRDKGTLELLQTEVYFLQYLKNKIAMEDLKFGSPFLGVPDIRKPGTFEPWFQMPTRQRYVGTIADRSIFLEIFEKRNRCRRKNK